MSANNKIIITKKEGNYIIYDIDMDTGFNNIKIGTEKELEKAILKAQEYMEDNEVEYGLDIKI